MGRAVTPAGAAPAPWLSRFTRFTPRWIARSVRNKLLAMALLPLLVVLPLLVAALVLWGHAAYERLLITKVRSDLAVAHGYFGQLLGEVGAGSQAVAASHALHLALAQQDAARLQALLAAERARLGFDFFTLEPAPAAASAQVSASGPAPGQRPPAQAASGSANGSASLALLSARELLALAPHLAGRLHIPLIGPPGATASASASEDRALVMLATTPVLGAHGEPLALLRAGVLLNQNLALIDHINRIVYPEGALPLGSHGTATLFLEDVRITTNVRLFQDQRAIGTKVSPAVREAVLARGNTWLDRAFVVNDWYVSAYEPLMDAAGQRIGMLYVGFLEAPFRWLQYGALGLIVGIFLLVMALAALFSLRWAHSIFRPVEQMGRTLQRAQDGDTQARVGALQAEDELGALARHLDHLLQVTEDKTQALQQWAGTLDARVSARTQELAQRTAALQQAQQQLVKSEKLAAIGQLTASVAHEINNPIAVMQGNLDLMRELLGAAARPVADELALLDQQVERMRLIVTELLQYARPTDYAGYVEAVDVNQSLNHALLLVGHLLAHTGIAVVRELQASASAGINRQELQRVLINLLSNAIQAMPQGGALLLRTQDQPDAQGRAGVLLEVCDSGAGLSGPVQAQLFRPFFTTKSEGNGLGLWISLELVERYGGRLHGANRRERGEESEGAVFSLWLPCEPLAVVTGC